MKKIKITQKEFNKLPKGERAVLVAKDVQQQLLMEKYDAAHTYCIMTFDPSVKSEDSMKDVLEKDNLDHCYVCARGALFLSTIRFKNILSVDDTKQSDFNYYDGRGSKYIRNSIFNLKQQSLIECAYEKKDHYGNGYCKYNDREAAAKYGRSLYKSFNPKLNKGWRTDSYILWYIMENIIENKGEFIIPKEFYNS